MKKYIVVISDCADAAFNEIRAQILKEIDTAKSNDDIIVEPLVAAKEFSIIDGAFLTRLMAELYPPEKTIFLVILNPLQKRPRRIIGETKNGFKFVGADTGTLSWLFEDFGIKEVYELKDPDSCRSAANTSMLRQQRTSP